MIEQAIYSLLSHNSSVTALISGRIYPQVRERTDGLPAITYQIISNIRGYDLSGPNDLAECRVQINCFAETAIGAAQLCREVRRALNGLRTGAEGVEIMSILAEDENDLPMMAAEDEQMNTYAKTMDFNVMYKEN
jgi:hypothetical protein